MLLTMATDAGVYGIDMNEFSARPWCLGMEECAVTALAVEPGATALLASTRGQGLYRLRVEDGQAERLGEGVLPQRLHCVAIDPHDPRWVAVGSEPAGVWFSHDGGEHWQASPAVHRLARERGWTYPVPTVQPHIRHLAFSRRAAGRLWAAVQVGGLLLSEDGGDTWVDYTDNLDPDVHAMVEDPEEPEHVYAINGGGGFRQGPPLGLPLYRSLDGGRTWFGVDVAGGRNYAITMWQDPRDSRHLLMGVSDQVPPRWADREGRANAFLMQSKDGGAEWTRITGEGLPDVLTGMIEAIVSRPGHPEEVILGVADDSLKYLKPPSPSTGSLYRGVQFPGHWQCLAADLPPVHDLAWVSR